MPQQTAWLLDIGTFDREKRKGCDEEKRKVRRGRKKRKMGKKGVRLNALQTFTTCTPTFWSGKVSTPKKME
jgi:hypothetical protein